MAILDSTNDIGRYGISALDKVRSREAVPYEIMCDFDTGEIVIKGIDGRVIGFNKNARLKDELDTFRDRCVCQNIRGDILEIIPKDTLNLPYGVTENTNILDGPIELSNSCKKVLISIDADTIEYTKKIESTNPATQEVTVHDSNFEFNNREAWVTLTLSINGVEKIINLPLKKLNTKVLCVSRMTNTTEKVSVIVKNISFARHDSDEVKDLKVLLYSIIYTCE